jgi:hypothetical protein
MLCVVLVFVSSVPVEGADIVISQIKYCHLGKLEAEVVQPTPYDLHFTFVYLF